MECDQIIWWWWLKAKCYTLTKESRTPRNIYQGDLELTLAAGWPSVFWRAWACVRSWAGAIVGTWLLACGWKGNKTGIRQNCRIRLESICFVSWLYVSIFFSHYLLVVNKIATAVLYAGCWWCRGAHRLTKARTKLAAQKPWHLQENGDNEKKSSHYLKL